MVQKKATTPAPHRRPLRKLREGLLALLVASATPVCLLGCVVMGTNFDMDTALAIQEGMTKEEVLKVMERKPDTVSTTASAFGSVEVWVWSYTIASAFGADGQTFTVTFTNGLVSSTARSTTTVR